MMRTPFVFALVGALGCTSSSPSSLDKADPVTPTSPQVEPDTKPPVEPDVVAAAITVEMTAATLADDCGGGPNTPPKARPVKTAAKHKGDEAPSKHKAKSQAERRCEQSSIQLAIAASAGAEPANVAVKSVELFLESGASVGKLEARAPSVWDADGYTPWNQKVEPGQDLSVSYALTQPDWTKVDDRWNQTYTVKAVLSMGGSDQTVQQSAVVAVAAPTSLPPGVKT